VRVNVLSGLLASAVLVTALNLTGGDSEKYFTAGLALVISTTFISYLLTFPSMLVLRRRMPDVARPFRAPFPVLTTVLTTGLVAFTVAVLIWPLELPPAFAGSRAAYTLSQVVPLLIVIGIGFAFYALGAPTRAQDREVPELTSTSG
jgi:amino acid transporter